MNSFTLGDTVAQRYLLGRELGRGGTAVVYEAEHLFTGRTVALKLVASELAASLDEEMRARMLREARGLGTVRHPSIVDVVDAGLTGDNVPFIAMEMLHGRTLEGILAARTRLDVENTVAVGVELAGALAALHGNGVIHRDVKPGNIFVVRDGSGRPHIKLMDLGIALSAEYRDRKLTARGNIVGTLEYMSVERLAGDDAIDPRSDVYAAGVTLFECLSGDVPFAGSLADVVRQVMPVDAEPARLRVPGVPHAIARVIERACARRQEDRYQNMDDFRADLVAAFGREPQLTLLDDAQAARRPPANAQPEPPARRKHARAPYTTPVRLTTASGPVDGRSEDISAGGMLIISRTRPKIDEKVVTRFALPIEGRVASVRGTVRWVRGGEKGPAAIGVEFDEPEPSLITSIDRYIEVMSRLG